MSGKELIYKAYSHQKTHRAPWVPFAGVHAGALKGYTASEVLVDAGKLLESLKEVHRLYMPDGMPIVFDLQLEAEILGCDLLWADDNPPSVISHVLENTNEIPSRLIEKNEGRLPLVLDVAKKMKELVGDETALYGLYCGPFTLASHLRGTNLFRDMKKNHDYVNALMNYCTDIALRMSDYYAECGMDVIAPVDPLVSQISPKYFNQYLAGPYSRIFKHLRGKNILSSFFVCGDALRNIECMCETGPDGISIDENIPMAKAKAITDSYNITIGGNIPLTTTMLFGSQMDNIKYVVDMIDSLDIRNLIVSPGCDMPYGVPLENAIAVAEAARDVDKYRELVRDYSGSSFDDIEVELPKYGELPRPLLEVCTLDSASCAACTYMWAMACDAKAKYGQAIDVVEYKYTRREDIARYQKMGVKNLPSMYLNGNLAYSSIIPNHEEFYEEIDKLL